MTTPRNVFVTGASTGIGRACALELARRGWRVLAGVRRHVDGDALRAMAPDAIVPVEIDVAIPASIAAAAKDVRRALGDEGLDGLVNNAGIGTTSPVEYVSEDELRGEFEVNVFGQIAVTQQMLPLIRRARGRIVNMGSIGSAIAFPFGGVLCASKSALRSFNDALRLELRCFGIRVCLIEPASIRTPAADKMLGDVEGVIRKLPVEGAARYGDKLRAFMRRSYAQEMNGSPPEVVARAVHRALTARRPRARYLVGAHAPLLSALPRLLPAPLLDIVRLRLVGLPAAFGSEPADSRA